MRPEVLDALARQGAPVSADGTIRLYHATDKPGAAAIANTMSLLPSTPEDPVLRERVGSSIWLASRPSILDDLPGAEVVLAVTFQPELTPEAEVLRDHLGDPPRTEIELMSRDTPLPLAYAADLRASTPAPSPAVADAIANFAESPVGQQLTDPAECRGRCKRAAHRFISALRAHDADGKIIEWAWDGAWHNAVVIDGDLVIDWTASQFYPALTGVHLASRAQADLRMLNDYDAPAGMLIDPDDKFLRRRVDAWEEARQPIPASEIDLAAFAASD